jgi:esterase/lipase
MEIFFFRQAQNKQLLGIYDAPSGTRFKDIGILLCYPIVHEYTRVHRAFKMLAKQLSKAGFHVFRFDYFANGDSSGEIGNVEQWYQDINDALNEFKEISNVKQFSIVGLRFGATLAINSIIKNNLQLKDLILWDPVINGQKYIEELEHLHKLTLNDLNRFPNSRLKDNNNDELLGFSFPQKLRDEIKQTNLNLNNNSKKISLIVSTEDKDYKALNVDNYICIPSDNEWNDFDKIESSFMPSEILQKIKTILLK